MFQQRHNLVETRRNYEDSVAEIGHHKQSPGVAQLSVTGIRGQAEGHRKNVFDQIKASRARGKDDVATAKASSRRGLPVRPKAAIVSRSTHGE